MNDLPIVYFYITLNSLLSLVKYCEAASFTSNCYYLLSLEDNACKAKYLFLYGHNKNL